MGQDFIINDDLEIENGDLKIANSDVQNQYAILRARKGQFYEFPTLGVGIEDYDHASIDKRVIRREIRDNLKRDNYRIDQLDIAQTPDGVSVNLNATKLK